MSHQSKKYFWIYTALIIAGASLLLGSKIHFSYYYGVILSLFFIWLSYQEELALQKENMLHYLRKSWGKEKNKKNTFDQISLLHRNLQESYPTSLVIDDRTWADLEMNRVFKQINHTVSTSGEQFLYDLLRRPLFDKKELEKREKLISIFSEQVALREKFQLALGLLGKDEGHYIPSFLTGFLAPEKKLLWLYRSLSFTVILIVLFFPFSPLLSLVFGLILFTINLKIHFDNRSKLFEKMGSLSYLNKMIGFILSLPSIEEGPLGTLISELQQDALKLRSLQRKMLIFSIKDPIGVSEYINILFLTEAITYQSTLQMVSKYKDFLLEMYMKLGYIDSMISIASYRNSLPYFTQPSLSKSFKSTLSVKEIYHPLIENSVSNSLMVGEKKILITGSNMSGKSTFLRTIGINAIFAQTLHTVLAKDYQANYTFPITSIATEDNLSKGESYYLVEAKRIQDILNGLTDSFPCLCIVDEIFRGTNTLERIAAAKEVLAYFSKHYSYVFAATHDLELTSLLSHSYENYHFEEKVLDEDIHFDYKIKSGPSRTRNALKILKLLGYPDEIPNNAEAYIRSQN